MQILITGGMGFIGSHLAIELNKQGHDIFLYDNMTRNAMDLLGGIPKGIKYRKADVRNYPDLFSAAEDCDAIIHCAAICGINTVGNIEQTLDVNIEGTSNVLRVASSPNAHPKRHVILMSTCEVLGTDEHFRFPFFENRWSYAASKIVGEYYGKIYSERGLPVTTVRPYNVYGPGQVGESAISVFIKNAFSDREFTIHNDGSQRRAWCYIDDFVDGIKLILDNKESFGKTYGIGNPQADESILGLATMIAEKAKIGASFKFTDHFCSDIEKRTPDIKGIKELGWSPKIDLSSGLDMTIDWYIRTLGL